MQIPLLITNSGITTEFVEFHTDGDPAFEVATKDLAIPAN
jgi:hypothetical protein